jgi:transposase-like protein
MPKRVDPELRARAVRLVNDHLGEYQNVTAASVAVAKQLGVDAGERPGVTSSELEEIKRLEAESRRLREDVAILKAATSFFVGELDPRNR